jgi:hypothetical protein
MDGFGCISGLILEMRPIDNVTASVVVRKIFVYISPEDVD